MIGPASTSAAGARESDNGLFSRFTSSIEGGGVSLESTRPMASIAPPSISVRSVIVVEDVNIGVREGDLSGRAGSSRCMIGV